MNLDENFGSTIQTLATVRYVLDRLDVQNGSNAEVLIQ